MGKPVKTGESWQVFLDVLRVAATLAVVLMHTVTGVRDGYFDLSDQKLVLSIFNALIDVTSWCVPIFLMISGYLFLNPERKITWEAAIFRFCRRIVLALAIFGIPYALLEIVGYLGYFEWFMLPMAVKHVLRGHSWSHMWYLYLILILYAVTPLMKWLLEKLPRAWVLGVMAALALGVGVIPFIEALLGVKDGFALPLDGIYPFYYLCGYVFVTRKKEPRRWEGMLSAVLFGVVLLIQIGCRFIEGYHVDMAYSYPLTILAAIFLFDFGWAREKSGKRKAEGSRLRKMISQLCPLCFGIYLIHPVFLNFFYKFLKITILDFRFYVGILGFFFVTLVGSVTGTWLLRKIPFFKKYVL
ncbi:MAG: acyltransferase [Lachnospiraceae bacterium]|jgi:surface polysaccharide O-acyltransferase-like enzyme|nr:acyltransferase [Lachnospiraceae bacterium]